MPIKKHPKQAVAARLLHPCPSRGGQTHSTTDSPGGAARTSCSTLSHAGFCSRNSRSSLLLLKPQSCETKPFSQKLSPRYFYVPLSFDDLHVNLFCIYRRIIEARKIYGGLNTNKKRRSSEQIRAFFLSTKNRKNKSTEDVHAQPHSL